MTKLLDTLGQLCPIRPMLMVCGLVYAYFLFSVNLPYCTTVYPRINVHALIFEDALNFRKQVHALIKKIF